MTEILQVKYRAYILKSNTMENLITEFYGKIVPDENSPEGLITIEFKDVTIQYDTITENIGAKMLSIMFLDAMKCFKKTKKTDQQK
jgi:hypothetical protein